ncbi:DUF2894 domain-containing protein [Paracidovorax sp. MALMAid1276]|uniref:DUF2894 domain-containing protein n=1 Tax=Paracidovorax sp. MALMAid1276 TaxID=3411631 RepID=UPI003B9A11F6
MGEPSLDALRAEGAERLDPVRFSYLQALAARLPAQPPAVQRLLQARLHAGLLDCAQQVRTRATQPPLALQAAAEASPLARLNCELQNRTPMPSEHEDDGAWAHHACGAPDMASVRRFGAVWAKISADQKVAQALQRGPENAGPLNPHRLLLRSLALMRNLSPEYLQAFVAQMDNLLWLEQSSARPARAPLRPGRAGRSKG